MHCGQSPDCTRENPTPLRSCVQGAGCFCEVRCDTSLLAVRVGEKLTLSDLAVFHGAEAGFGHLHAVSGVGPSFAVQSVLISQVN